MTLVYSRYLPALPTQVVLNPQPQLTDMPLKSYYRYALPSFAAPERGDGEAEAAGDEEGIEQEDLPGPPNPPAATFTGLPGVSHKPVAVCTTVLVSTLPRATYQETVGGPGGWLRQSGRACRA